MTDYLRPPENPNEQTRFLQELCRVVNGIAPPGKNSVKYYGAKGDGVSDDTGSIQDALDSLYPAMCFFPPGTYLCKELTIPDGAYLYGIGATLVCDAIATATHDWIRASGAEQGGTVEGLVFDYNSNTNGRHILNLGTNARGWKISECEFWNMKTRAALRADYPTTVAGDGYITVEKCLFSGGDAAGAIAFYAELHSLGIKNVTVKNCDIEDCGGSIMLIGVTEGANRFGGFENTIIENVRIEGNGTGTHGAIPMELWGHDGVSVRGCHIDSATRGIGFGWCRDITSVGNVIKNQTIYAHEVGNIQRAVFANETVYDCGQFLHETAGTYETNDVAITGNLIVGSGITSGAYLQNIYAIQFSGEGTEDRNNVLISNNTFVDLDYLSGCIRLDRAYGASITNNMFIANNILSPTRFINTRNLYEAYIFNNTIVRRSNFTPDSPFGDGVAFFISTGIGSGAVIKNNLIITEGADTSTYGLRGIGSSSAPEDYSGIKIQDNTLKGVFSRGINLNDSSGEARVLNNDLTEVVASVAKYDLTGVVFQDRSNEFSGAAAPVSGTWERGDRVYNHSPAASDPIGWVCVTAGTPGTWKVFGTIAA